MKFETRQTFLRAAFESSVDLYGDPPIPTVARDHAEYIRAARMHPFVQLQIAQGLYDDETFDTTFIGVARLTYSLRLMQEVIEFDPWLMAHHMRNVQGMTTLIAYAQVIAAHEMSHVLRGFDGDHVHDEQIVDNMARDMVGEQTYALYERALAESHTLRHIMQKSQRLLEAPDG